jgi:hypothetical protein
MSVVLSARTPAQIASDINSIKRRTDKIMLENYVQIGRCLTEAQATVPYGEWSKWLKEEVNYSRRTAYYLMKIYREFGPKLASLDGGLSEVVHPGAQLGFSQAVILLEIPSEERDKFMACHDVENMSKRELQEAVQEKKQSGEPVPVVSQAPATGVSGPIPVVHVVKKLRKVPYKTVQVSDATNSQSLKYDEEFDLQRDILIKTYDEIFKILFAQNRIDTARKEANRKKALEISTNMVQMLQEYPPAIRTNL